MEKQATGKHRRIPMAEIRETPKDGYYITKKDVQRFRFLSAAFLGITGLSLLLSRKK